MILNSKPEVEKLSGVRKAAMLLIVLGEQASSDVLRHLNEDEIQRVSHEVARITSISAEQAETILTEFNQIATAGDYVARGGIDYARKLLTRTFAPDVAKRINAPYVQSTVALDTIQTGMEIDARLSQLEQLARTNGSAAGTASASPVTIARRKSPKVRSTGGL